MGRCTRGQVAERAGVSPAVVSYVLGGTARAHRISEATAERVRAASAALGYRPNIWGRVLKTQRSNVIVFVSEDLTDPNTVELIGALGGVVRARGLGLMLSDLGGESLECGEGLRAMESSMADAFLLHAPLHGLPAGSPVGAFEGKPCCVLGRHMPGGSVSSVEVDNARGAELAVAHLLARGATRLGVIADRREYAYTQARLAGCRKALAAGGQSGPRLRFRAGHEDQLQAGAAAVEGWQKEGLLPDGIFAMGDVMAFGALSALHTAGVRCPAQVRIVGFDGTPMARYASPSLSTVRQPFTAMAESALAMVQALLDGKRLGKKHLLLEPDLVVRASSGG